MNRIALTLMAGVAVFGFASSTYAADLIVDEPISAGVVEVSSGNWDGPYIGAFVGYGAGNWDENDGDYTNDLSGWLAGVNVGVNFTLTEGIVAGVVGDLAWSNLGFEDGGYDVSVDWTGSVRGKLGFDGGSFLPYLTAGIAFAGATVDDGAGDSQTHIGWTVGAGVEFAATENMSIDLGYRYSDYGDQTYNIGFGDYDVDFQTHQVTLGLNWKF